MIIAFLEEAARLLRVEKNFFDLSEIWRCTNNKFQFFTDKIDYIGHTNPHCLDGATYKTKITFSLEVLALLLLLNCISKLWAFYK